MKKIDFFKQRAIYIILGITVLITLFCIVKIIKPNRQYFYNGETRINSGEEEYSTIIYDQIALLSGVYDVVLEYQTDSDMKNRCTVEDGTVFTNGLLTNGEHLHQHLNNTDYRMWLFESTEAIQVCIVYGGEGSVVTGDLTIKETDALWTFVLTVVWSIAFLIVVLLALGKYDRTVGVEQEKKNVMFVLFAIVLIASLPYLQGGCMLGADLVYHLHRIEGVKDGILSGQFPLRIEPSWLFDHGYANSVFYCNTLLYFPAILRLLGFTVTESYNMYCIALNIATACISYFCFSKIFKNRYIGLLCSALYTLSVFRIYKLVITAAVGEGSAVTFMPLVFYGLYRAFSEDVRDKRYKTVWIPIAAGYAGLIQTHVLSCEITAFLTIIVCLAFFKKIFVKETFWELAKGALSAIAMSFWYLIPFLDYYMNEDMHIRHVSARTIQDRGLYLPQLFFHWWKLGDNALSGDLGMVESHAMGAGLILGIGFVVFFILWFSGKLKQKGEKTLALGRVSWLLGGMLMLMSLNIFPWDWIQHRSEVTASLVSSIQFPNRFLGWGTVFLVAVIGCILWYFKKNEKKWYYYLSVILILVGITTSSVYLVDFVDRDKSYIYMYNEEGMGFGYISGAEYLVEGTEQELLEFSIPTTSENVEISGYGKEYLYMWAACVNRGTKDEYVEFPLLHYTGYRAYITETGEELLTEKGNNNLVRVKLPAGFDGEIEVKFVSPIHWRISEAVTYVWWVFAGAMCLRKLCGNQKRKREKELCVKQ